MQSVPLHTRVITVRLLYGGPDTVTAEAELIDLRKRSIVPLGASLRGPGVVHHMRLRADVDIETRSIAAIAAANGVDPFEAAYDAFCAEDGRALLMLPLLNYADGDHEDNQEAFNARARAAAGVHDEHDTAYVYRDLGPRDWHGPPLAAADYEGDGDGNGAVDADQRYK